MFALRNIGKSFSGVVRSSVKGATPAPSAVGRRGLTASSPKLWQLTDPWFDQYPQIGEYMAQDGFPVRLPLRLFGHQCQVYGTADLGKILEDLEDWGEDWTPATVGGKVPFQFGFNHFLDTDCGAPDTRNPYLETWTEFPVTRKHCPLAVPYKEDGDLVAIDGDERVQIFVHRVLCAYHPEDVHKVAAMSAISGGSEMWGFPKHRHPAQIRWDYHGENITQSTTHCGKMAIEMTMKLPEFTPGHKKVSLDWKSEPGKVIGGPRWMYKQTTFKQDVLMTQFHAPWDPKTDSLVIGNDPHYGGVSNKYGFVPKLKINTRDFRVVAFQPEQWNQLDLPKK